MKTIYLLCIISSFINGVFGDEVKSVSVIAGDSLTLHTDTKLQSNDLIVWTSKDVKDPIAKLDRADNKIEYGTVGRFRGRLKLSTHTGDLTITNITTKHSGVYQLDIIRDIVITKKFNVIGVVDPGEVKSVSVMEGDSVTLHSNVADVKKYDEIGWKFGNQETLIAIHNKADNKPSIYDDVLDKRFKGRLQMNDQTGDLTITDIRIDQPQVYKLDLRRSSSRYTIHQSFNVTVSGEVKSMSVMQGDPVTLHTDVPDIKTYDLIEWMFGVKTTQIAEINNQEARFATFEGQFSDRLKMNSQTGSLTINNVKTDDSGDYAVKMSSRRRSIYRTLKVKIIERGLSQGAVAGISLSIILLAAVAAGGAAGGVIYRQRKTKEQKKLGKILNMKEGESVDLKTEVKDIKSGDLIEWRFEETLIAKINPANNIFNTYDGDDDLFRDKLELNHQTGDLNINDIRQKHDGVYTLKIIRDGETSYKRSFVFVRGETKTVKMKVKEGESVNLKTEVTEIKIVEKIEWRFGEKETLIAEINPANNFFRTYNDDDKGLSKDKLKLNHQTGDLNISDIRQKRSGVYLLKIISDGETSYKRFNVFVRGNIKTLQVNEGKSVDLKTEFKDIKSDEKIEWRFGNKETPIAEIKPADNISKTFDGDYGEFKNKLNLNHQTGDLIINDIREEHKGVYTLKITRGRKTSYRRFRVTVRREREELEVYEGESVNLKTKVTDIQRVDVIEWRFGDKETFIVEINPADNIFSTYDGDYGEFRDKLKLNRQTGDITINDSTWEHDGDYRLKIIRDGETSYKTISVSVRCEAKILEVDEGKSADLKTEVKDIKRINLIEWRFGETLIAEINPVNHIFSTYDGDDDLFRDKLKLNHKTGDLNINDIKEKHTGVYKLSIFRGGKPSLKRFNMKVRSSRGEGPVENRGECLVRIEMQPLLHNISQQQ